MIDWNAISAIGTIMASFVGIIGIWINLWDKKKRLSTNFEMYPPYKIFISNNSLRTVVITKMVCSINNHIIYVERFSGLEELRISPASIQSITLSKGSILESYEKLNMSAFCNSNEKINITIHDNFGRKYKIKTDLTIGFFRE